MSQDRRFYVVRGRVPHGLITHRCPTAEFALDSLRRFMRENMVGISVVDPDGIPLTLGELEILGSQAASPKQHVPTESV